MARIPRSNWSLIGLLLWASSLAAGDPITSEHALVARNGKLFDCRGVRVGLYGVNLYQSHLGWSRRQDPACYEEELKAIAEFGFNAVRMPMNMAWFEPQRGIFPDSPQYANIMRSHRLPAGAVAFYDGLIRRAGELGLYVIPEFHELPIDPYRWFVGGREENRDAGKPGRAIAWMGKADEKGRYRPDPELARAEVPRALGWLAKHWRGVANIAGIEVPWNEPRGPLTEPQAYFDLVRACARAVKSADPDRLVFMDCVDWGAMVNRMPDESVWKLPEEVDGLFPHFYPGMHSGGSGEAGTWSTTMANWVSWLAGSGEVVMVGEYGTVEMTRARYWKDGSTDAQRAATYASCAAQWYAMGVQGVFAWAWQGGIHRDAETGALTKGAQELPKWAAPFRESVPALADAAVAVICAPNRRSPYGSRKDLWMVADALLDAHLTPFATIFSSQVLAQPHKLQRFRVLLVLTADLPQQARNAASQSGRPAFEVLPDLSNLDEAVRWVKAATHATSADWPDNVIVGYARRQATVFERKGRGGTVQLKLDLPGAKGRGRLVTSRGYVLFAGAAEQVKRHGVQVPLVPWQCEVLRWQNDP